MDIPKIYPAILSGGSGTRLWPLSRENQPKQLFALGGPRTLLQETARRLEGYSTDEDGCGPIIVVCNIEHRFVAAEQLRAAGASVARIAPALALATLAAQAQGADPIVLVMPADHVVTDRPAFQTAVATGLPAASGGALVTFDIVPSCPETGYGYIRAGARRDDGALKIAAFVEKPDYERACGYVASGEYLWNSGVFMMRARVSLEALAALAPTMPAACKAAFDAAKQDLDLIRIDAEAFSAFPSDSIDYAVMKKLAAHPQLRIEGVVVHMAAGWSDVGAWDALWEVMDKDEAGNACHGDTVLKAVPTAWSMAQNDSSLAWASTTSSLWKPPTPWWWQTSPAPRTSRRSSPASRPRAEASPRATVVLEGGTTPLTRRALPGQTHCGQSRRQAEPADTPPPC